MSQGNFLIRSAVKTDFPLLETFILPYEHFCVQLASFIRRKEKDLYVIFKSSPLPEIWGIIYLNKALFHCLPFLKTEEDLNSFSPVLNDFLEDKKIKTIIGTKTQTELLLKTPVLKAKNLNQKNFYTLMTLQTLPPDPPAPFNPCDEIKRCTEYDLENLLDLQKKYLIKEVAPAGKKVTDLECSLGLKEMLKNQLVLALTSDGEIVSKANTNAIGINWVQLGGVYTHPLYRNNYYAWHLIRVLCYRIMKTQKSVCLFVKEKNTPASNLYKRMGFSEKEGFEIVYFTA